MTTKDNISYMGTSYYPDGTPVPDLLTEQEAIRFLRLDGDDGPKNPRLTLQHYRDEDILRATRVGKKLRYTRTELLRFLEKMTEKTKKSA